MGSIPTRSRQRTLLALFLIPFAAQAQQVRGSVLLPDSSGPAPSVIVTASDARGGPLARGVTDSRGEFVLVLPAPGRIVVRALRVGYRPTVLAEREVGVADTLTLRIVLTNDAVRLAAITVTRRDECRARDDTRARVADVWEEARKALVLANTARRNDALFAEWAQFDRQLDSLGRRVLDQTVDIWRAPSERPFRSRDATLLARDGYIVEDEAGVSYFAPDAEVLLSESFAGTHCFKLVSGPDGSDLLGISFRPVDGSAARRDVTGVLWLDRASAELRFLEFAYTGLPAPAEPAEPGGRVEFRRIVDGAWLVTRWQIRMPALERVLPSHAVGGRLRIIGPSLVLRGVKVVGGEVTRVERNGTEVYRAPGSALVVQVAAAQTESQVAAAGARVMLVGTDYAALSDSTGAAHFPFVIAGRYRVAVTTAALEEDHDPPVQREVEIGGDSLHVLQLRLPARRMDAAALGLVPRQAIHASVEFTVADSLGNAIAGVEIVAVDAAGVEHRLRSDSAGRADLNELPLGDMRVEARSPGFYLAYGTVSVADGRTPAKVLLERMQGRGTLLEAVRIEETADERMRYGAFEARRRAGATTATITREQIQRRNPVNAWQMLLNVGAAQLIEGPEGVIPVSRRVKSMDFIGDKPCYMRLAIDGVLLPDVPVNLSHRLPPTSDVHGIEVFAGPATIPPEYAGDQRNMVCGLIVVWTR